MHSPRQTGFWDFSALPKPINIIQLQGQASPLAEQLLSPSRPIPAQQIAAIQSLDEPQLPFSPWLHARQHAVIQNKQQSKTD
jgi:hypothetical protein